MFHAFDGELWSAGKDKEAGGAEWKVINELAASFYSFNLKWIQISFFSRYYV